MANGNITIPAFDLRMLTAFVFNSPIIVSGGVRHAFDKSLIIKNSKRFLASTKWFAMKQFLPVFDMLRTIPLKDIQGVSVGSQTFNLESMA